MSTLTNREGNPLLPALFIYVPLSLTGAKPWFDGDREESFFNNRSVISMA